MTPRPRLWLRGWGAGARSGQTTVLTTSSKSVCDDGSPSQAMVDKVHADYVRALRALFEKHKARCGCPDAELVIT